MNRRRLPIGIQTFKEISQGGYYYVEKTPIIKRLAEGGKYYFLSRPRRFGKSLFLDTLAEAFSGNRELFKGLYLLAALGLDITPEDVTSHGQCDLAIRYGNRVYLFEFKVIEGEEATGEAIKQLISKGYASKYRDSKTEVIQIGIEFSRVKRQIVGWDVVV